MGGMGKTDLTHPAFYTLKGQHHTTNALKGQYLPAQGNALGDTSFPKNIALKGQHLTKRPSGHQHQ